jgi:hypothetical protein
MEVIGNTTNSKSERGYGPPTGIPQVSLRGWIQPASTSTQFPVSNNPTNRSEGGNRNLWDLI